MMHEHLHLQHSLKFDTRKASLVSALGVLQAETYRRMKRATRGDWAGFHPVTNCMWVHYLADTLLKHKDLPATRPQKDALQGFRCSLRSASVENEGMDSAYTACLRAGTLYQSAANVMHQSMA